MEKILIMLIGNKLRGLRVEKGFTISQMADRLEISEPTYRKFENDKTSPDLETINKIAQVLEKNFLELLPSECFQQNYNQSGGIAYLLNHGTVNNSDKDHIESLKQEIEFLKKLLK